MIDKPHAPSCERNREPILAVLRAHLADRRHVLEIGSGTGQHAVHFAAAMPGLAWQCSDRAEYLAGIRMWLDEAGLANTPPPVALDVAAGPWPWPAPLLLPPLPLAGEGRGEGTRARVGSDRIDTRSDRRLPIGARPHTPRVLPSGRPPCGHLLGSAHPAGAAAGEGNNRFDAAFTANSLHIMGWPEVEALFAGLDTALADDATLVVYGPFNYAGASTSDSNRAFDASLQARDPRMGIRDFEAVDRLAGAIGLRLVADVPMPANNRCLVWRRGRVARPA